MRYIFALLVIMLSGCGASYHAKRAQHHIQKAIEKGADISKQVTTDTVYIEKIMPGVAMDTIVSIRYMSDTVIQYKDRVMNRIIRLPGERIMVETTVTPDTIKVPYTVTNTGETNIEVTKVPWWVYVLCGIAIIVILMGCWKLLK